MQRWLLAPAIAVALLPLESASADSSSIAVLAVEIAGDAAPELRPKVAESIADGLSKAGKEVVPLDAVMESLAEAPELIGCTSTACLERIAERIDAREFVRARLRADGVTYTLDLELLVADAEESLADQLDADCTVCTMTELFEWVSATSAELLLPDRTGSAAIVIQTEPAGATVEIGGRPIGRAPTEAKLPVGHHDITARLDGHAQAATTIRIEEGDPGPHEVVLMLVPHEPEGSAHRAPPFGPWKWVTAGGAVASIATSIALFSMHGNPTCDLQPPQTQCPRERDGVTPGLVGLGVGAVLGGVSGWMFYQDAASRGVTITSGPGGAGAGVAFRF